MNGLMPMQFGDTPQAPMNFNPLLPQLNSDAYSAMGAWGNGGQPQGFNSNFDFSGGGGGQGGGIWGGISDWWKNSGVASSKSVGPNGETVETQGFGAPALQAGTALLNAWMGMKQYGLAKDTLNEGKRQFGLNYAAQKATTNSALEDRQRARVASNGGAYQSVGDYMTQNGIK